MNDPQIPQDPSKDPLLLDHDADGIKELDNNLPRWWVWLFNLCVVFALVYFGYYHVLGKGDLQIASYDKDLAAGNALKQAALSKFETEMASAAPSKESATMAQGQQLFVTYCAPCHRPDGGGLVGPNLCDDYWIHGPQYVDTVKVIWNGVPDKGMLAWKEQGFKPSDILAVASYIYTLRGSNPPDPKPREDQAPKTTENWE
jgi:cytochrome c oxidase cbb3-type subunit III